MENLPDHPAVAMALETGYPSLVHWPVCPVCGAQCQTIFIQCESDERLGCEFCYDGDDDYVVEVDAWEETS